MNFFDIVTIITLVWAVVAGWRSGLVAQLFSLAGVALGVVLSLRYGEAVGVMLGIDERFAAVAGFLIIFVVSLIVASILSWMLRKVLKFVGLSWVNTLLGIILSVVKGVLVLALIFISVKALNGELQIIEQSYIDSSYTFDTVCTIAKPIFDYLVEAKDMVVNTI